MKNILLAETKKYHIDSKKKNYFNEVKYKLKAGKE
jgi:hypothetical protein